MAELVDARDSKSSVLRGPEEPSEAGVPTIAPKTPEGGREMGKIAKRL
jgi:hypothetical protein